MAEVQKTNSGFIKVLYVLLAFVVAILLFKSGYQFGSWMQTR